MLCEVKSSNCIKCAYKLTLDTFFNLQNKVWPKQVNFWKKKFQNTIDLSSSFNRFITFFNAQLHQVQQNEAINIIGFLYAVKHLKWVYFTSSPLFAEFAVDLEMLQYSKTPLEAGLMGSTDSHLEKKNNTKLNILVLKMFFFIVDCHLCINSDWGILIDRRMVLWLDFRKHTHFTPFHPIVCL